MAIANELTKEFELKVSQLNLLNVILIDLIPLKNSKILKKSQIISVYSH